jgi:hypothetical protein
VIIEAVSATGEVMVKIGDVHRDHEREHRQL